MAPLVEAGGGDLPDGTAVAAGRVGAVVAGVGGASSLARLVGISTGPHVDVPILPPLDGGRVVGLPDRLEVVVVALAGPEQEEELVALGGPILDALRHRISFGPH